MNFPRSTRLQDSKTIKIVEYNREERRMRIHFYLNGAVWDYFDVAPTEYASIVAATSPGAVYNERVRGRYISAPIHFHEEEGEHTMPTKKQRGQIVLLDNYDQL